MIKLDLSIEEVNAILGVLGDLHFHMDEEWNEAKFDPEDPRNSLVDPDRVVEAYKAQLSTGKTKNDNVVCLSA